MKRPSPIHKKLQRCRRLLLWHIFAQGLLKSLILITLGVGLSLLLEITLWLPSWGRALLYFSCLGLTLCGRNRLDCLSFVEKRPRTHGRDPREIYRETNPLDERPAGEFLATFFDVSPKSAGGSRNYAQRKMA